MHLSSVHKPGEGMQLVKFLYREQEGGFKLCFLSLFFLFFLSLFFFLSPLRVILVC